MLPELERVALPWLDLYGDPRRLLDEISGEHPLDVDDPMPLHALATEIGDQEQISAVERAVGLTVQRAQRIEERALSQRGDGRSAASRS